MICLISSKRTIREIIVLSVFRFFGVFFGFVCILCWLCPFGNKFLFIKKKKIMSGKRQVWSDY